MLLGTKYGQGLEGFKDLIKGRSACFVGDLLKMFVAYVTHEC